MCFLVKLLPSIFFFNYFLTVFKYSCFKATFDVEIQFPTGKFLFEGQGASQILCF